MLGVFILCPSCVYVVAFALRMSMCILFMKKVSPVALSAPNAGQDVLDVGIVSHLAVVMLQKQLVAPEHERPTLPKRILHVPGGQILDANVIGGVLVGLAQRREGILIVPFHHGGDGGGVPHRLDALAKVEGIAGGAALVAVAQGGIDVELPGKLGGGFGGTDADEEDLGAAGSGWEYARL